MMANLVLLICSASLAVGIGAGQSPDKPMERKFASAAESKTEFERVVAPLLKKHCQGCHNAKVAEGELDFQDLDADMKASTSAARWAMVIEKLSTREMPPEGRAKPSDEEIKSIVVWIQAEMKRAGKNFARRHAIANGNKVAHARLFDPKQSAPFDNPARLRLLSPEIYTGFSTDLAKGLSLGQPFTPEGRTTFKDMGAPKVDEPIAVQVMRNALAIVERQTAHKIEGGKLVALPGAVKEMLPYVDEQVPLTPGLMDKAIQTQFQKVLSRTPTAEEKDRHVKFMEKNVKDAGRVTGMRYALVAVYLMPEAIFRYEIGAGKADEQGRIRLAPREIAYALAYALTDKRPDARLLGDAIEGKLNTREGVAAAVRRLLDEPKEKPRIKRFFREYFGYDKATEVFQEAKANPEHDSRVLVEDTDKLIEYILAQDKQVLHELLTTNKSFVAYKTAADTKKKRADAIAKFEEQKKKDPAKFQNKMPQKVGKSVYLAYNLTDFPDRQPVELPVDQRAGILTQPSWLAANAKTDENHAIFRGKWVRERLLGGVVPDIPITVDAQLPIAPDKTLRERMNVTRQDYCYKCHQFMNPVGLPFEIYDHFGRFRTTESLVDPGATAKKVDKKGKTPPAASGREVPVDASGAVSGTNEAAVDGEVKNAVEMLRKLAKSEHVEQVFVRHAFRYWMGRNENLGDAASLQAAHKAYKDNNGSMKALIVSLLSSDSFLYRTPTVESKK